MRVYSLTIKNRAAALALGVTVLGAGAALVVVGLALLATLAVAGGVLGAGVLAYRALRGDRTSQLGHGARTAGGLDPALEVFSDQGAPSRVRDAGAPNERRPRLGSE